MPHTPGPWTIDSYGSEPAIRTDGGMNIVPRVFGNADDARLIAAAPELLAACKRAVANGKHPESCDIWDKFPQALLRSARPCDCYLSRIVAAIAKAEGK